MLKPVDLCSELFLIWYLNHQSSTTFQSVSTLSQVVSTMGSWSSGALVTCVKVSSESRNVLVSPTDTARSTLLELPRAGRSSSPVDCGISNEGSSTPIMCQTAPGRVRQSDCGSCPSFCATETRAPGSCAAMLIADVPKPTAVGLPYEDVTLTCSDGVKVKAFVIPARKHFIPTDQLKSLPRDQWKARLEKEVDDWSREMGTEDAIQAGPARRELG